MLDIILYGTPKSWQKEMDRQGFDPMDDTLNAVVDFMERIEATDDFDINSEEVKSSKKNSKKKERSTEKKTPANGKKFCLLHGEGNHSTDECHALQKEAKRLKSNNYNGSDKKPEGGSKNKTWTTKAADEKSKADGMMAALVKKEVKKYAKKHAQDLAAFSAKKRKDTEDSDSDDDTVDLAAFDLKDFNYEDMENLKIDGDEVSV